MNKIHIRVTREPFIEIKFEILEKKKKIWRGRVTKPAQRAGYNHSASSSLIIRPPNGRASITPRRLRRPLDRQQGGREMTIISPPRAGFNYSASSSRKVSAFSRSLSERYRYVLPYLTSPVAIPRVNQTNRIIEEPCPKFSVLSSPSASSPTAADASRAFMMSSSS